MQVHAHAAGAAGELFLDLQDLLLVEAPSAVLLGEGEAVQVVLDGEIVELLRELVRHLDLRLHLLERTLGQLADLLEVGLELLFGQFAHVNPFPKVGEPRSLPANPVACAAILRSGGRARPINVVQRFAPIDRCRLSIGVTGGKHEVGAVSFEG